MKVIETEYKGYRFRSRLEARWAVFFDALGIKWQYEPEGFELPNGIKWLPDFYLPNFDMYVEVKGSDEQLKKDFYKLGAFVDWDGPLNGRIMILGNIPDYNMINSIGFIDCYWLPAFIRLRCRKCVCGDYVTFMINQKNGVHISQWDEEPCLSWDSECWSACISELDCSELIKNGEEIGFFSDDDFTINDEFITQKGCSKKYMELLQNAYKRARQARFEHGEKP